MLVVTAVGLVLVGRSVTVPKRITPKPPSPLAKAPASATAKIPARPPAPPPRIAKPEPRRDPAPARPEERQVQLRLRVVGVHDGDTLTGLDDAKTQHKIRLAAIDAPELGQPYGQAAKRALSSKVFGKEVEVIPQTTDRYGRTVGRVLVADRDMNLEMVEEGMAWHYKHYDDSERLREAERAARAATKGLWQDRDPEPPWEWRKQERGRRSR